MNLQWAKGWFPDFTPPGIEKCLREMFAPDVDFEDVPLAHKASTTAGIAAFFNQFAGGKSRHRFEVTNYAGDSNSGAIEWTWVCDHEDDIMGVPSKGKRTTVKGISYVKIRDGRIIAERDYWDAATLMRQLGAIK